MKTVTAYQAEDGSLHNDQLRALATDLSMSLPKDVNGHRFSFSTAITILEQARVVQAALDQLAEKEEP